MEKINDLNIIYLVCTDIKHFTALLVFALFSYWIIRKVNKINKELTQMLINGESYLKDSNESKAFK